ncbi:MAG TPA: TatD family hydrolase [Chitinophagaceae bacterium]|nr:TatD family hydrolase [Chitinophagaceae bacterium]HNF70987.1 TatD family hydrolase [Chitinophagaceae bacterium]
MTDTHTHLYDAKFDSDRHERIQAAIDSGIERLLMPNCDRSTVDGMLQLEHQFPGHCIAMMGLHPTSVKDDVDEELASVYNWLKKRSFVAVGEIGLDYYWDKTHVESQKKAFEQQMEWALEFHLPIAIHTREAMNDTIELVKPFAKRGLKGVFHCFSGSYESAQRILDIGFFLGIGGVLTYKNAGVQEVVQKISLEHLVLETDAPYLSPVPHRGKRNESLFIWDVARHLSVLKSVPLEEIEAQTDRNARILFPAKQL